MAVTEPGQPDLNIEMMLGDYGATRECGRLTRVVRMILFCKPVTMACWVV